MYAQTAVDAGTVEAYEGSEFGGGLRKSIAALVSVYRGVKCGRHGRNLGLRERSRWETYPLRRRGAAIATSVIPLCLLDRKELVAVD